MFALYRKEIFKFFNSAVAYLIVAVFLSVNSLFLWFFEGNNNILNNPYASLDSFFRLSPWLLAIIIPAITMGMISEEKKQGTLELLLTHPVSQFEIYAGKWLAALSLIVISLVPTLLYVYSIYSLSIPMGDIDLGAITASYFALILISGVFISIGLFSSSLSSNQIVAFILAVIISIFLYIGPEYLSEMFSGSNSFYFLKKLGMWYHFENMALGLIELSDIVYFLSLLIVFSLLTINLLNTNVLGKAKLKSLIQNYVLVFAGLLVVNVFVQNSLYRIDFTEDNKYTLNQKSIDFVEEIDSTINVKVLLGGNLPVGFKKLEFEAQRILKDLRKYNSNISYSFGAPSEIKDKTLKNSKIEELQSLGISPINLEVNKGGEKSSKLIFPWAIISSGDRVMKVNLLKSKIGLSPEQQLNNSIENVEYSLIDAIEKVNKDKKANIAILKGHNELNDAYLSSFLAENSEYYNFERLFLNNNKSISQKQDLLSGYDLVMIIKPSSKISEEEKLLLDQYIMKGGKTMWMIDGVYAEMDSLQRDGRMLAFPREMGIGDMLFKYGVRINQEIVKDVQFAPIKLASGSLGSNVQYHTFPWPYFPLSIPESKHPIVKNIEAVKFQFASSIDTISNTNTKKEILLKSSEFTNTLSVPNYIYLAEVEQEINPLEYNKGEKNLAVLVEGEFNSAYKNRILPVEINNFKEKGENSKMLVFSDGDLIANQFQNGNPLPLGYDKWFNKSYGNGELISNSINYLLDSRDILSIKKKEIKLQLINKEKAKSERSFWQFLNLIAPLMILAFTGALFSVYRIKKYRK